MKLPPEIPPLFPKGSENIPDRFQRLEANLCETNRNLRWAIAIQIITLALLIYFRIFVNK